MSNDNTRDEDEEEEEEEELFYESLDRVLSTPSSLLCSPNFSPSPSSSLLSSPSSSCSSIPDLQNVRQWQEQRPIVDQSENRNSFGMPRFANYELWTSQPSSVEERRQRLLRDMGLIDLAPSLDADHGDTDRCVAEEQSNSGSSSALRTIGRSESGCDPQCNISTSSSSPSIRSSVNSSRSGCKSRSNGSIVVNFGSSSSPNKPPSGKSLKKSEEVRRDFSVGENPNPSLSNPLSGLGNAGEDRFGDDLDCNGEIVRSCDQGCTIKDLDNGKEFVVNEFGADGVCNKLREVGTGRQLTMEEFEICVGHSPIVQELMRRQNVEHLNHGKDEGELTGDSSNSDSVKSRKKGGWFKSIKNVANSVTGYRDRRSSDERDTSSERGGRRSSSATDDSQDVSFHGPERVRVRQYGKSCKEFTAVYKTQEIQAHNGAIWSIKFSLDGRYLATAGEDCAIHVWQVVESDRKDFQLDKRDDGNLNLLLTAGGSPEPTLLSSNIAENVSERKRRGRASISRKSISLDNILVPESVFLLSEKPFRSFYGHKDVVLDLSWSKSQYLLSSSMDKTVRLWDMTTDSCLKVFSHSDYVTCIQFNPVDDRYFISGSLDAKVRIWSIPDRQVVDWNDLHEMVTATCYTPDGQGALVGSYKGSCCLYNTSENKLHHKRQINLQNKKKKSHLKKITGFQFAPGSSSEVLITSADSRIRVIDGVDLIHKFKGFSNTSSQISASLTANGKFVICASADSHVYVWNHEANSRPSRSKIITVTSSYEYFHCQDVSVAIPWPGIGGTDGALDTCSREHSRHGSHHDEVSAVSDSPLLDEESNGHAASPSIYGCINSPINGTLSSVNSSYFFDRISATWPEENLLLAGKNPSPLGSVDFSNGLKQSSPAWGTVIVTAGLRGEIKTFQNFGLPYRI